MKFKDVQVGKPCFFKGNHILKSSKKTHFSKTAGTFISVNDDEEVMSVERLDRLPINSFFKKDDNDTLFQKISNTEYKAVGYDFIVPILRNEAKSFVGTQ